MIDFSYENQIRQNQILQQQELWRQQEEQRRIFEEQQRQAALQFQNNLINNSIT